MKRFASRALPLILLVLLFITAGCDQAGQSSVNPSAGGQAAGAPATAAATETMKLTVYFATKDAMNLVPEVQVVPKNDRPAQTAVELALGSPKNPELVRTLPEGIKVKGITVKDRIAYVDFSDKLAKGRGGSTAEILAVGAIVNTLTEFPEIHKVQILVEGKKIDTLYGHLDTSEPMGRSESIIKK